MSDPDGWTTALVTTDAEPSKSTRFWVVVENGRDTRDNQQGTSSTTDKVTSGKAEHGSK